MANNKDNLSKNIKLSRREFIVKAGWAIAGINLLPFLSFDKSKDTKSNTTVGVIKSGNRKEATMRALDLNSLPDMRGDSVLVKPNFNTADPAPGSTHNDTLETVIELIQNQGAARVIIGERSGPPVTEEVMREKGVFELAEKMGVEVMNFDKLGPDELLHFTHKDLHWKNGFHIPAILKEVDHIIAAGCLKTHQFGGQFTMALKLAVGIIPDKATTSNYMGQLHGSPDMRKKIAEINLLGFKVLTQHPPIFQRLHREFPNLIPSAVDH